MAAPLSYGDFLREHLRRNEPALISSELTSSWPARCEWLDTDGSLHWDVLKSRLGGARVAALDCETQECKDMLFSDLLEQWQAGAGRQLYAKDWHLPLWLESQGMSAAEALYDVPSIVRDDWMNSYYLAHSDDDFRFAYFGGAATFTPLHRDVYCSYSVSTNVYGRKRWWLFPPTITPLLQPHLREAELQDDRPDVRKLSEDFWHQAGELGAQEIIQYAGETIFVPSGWYHQVENLDHPTLSINHNWTNATNIRAVYYALRADDEQTCEALSDVRELMQRQPKWEAEWEACVADVLSRNAGWDWLKFWRMVKHNACPEICQDCRRGVWIEATHAERPSADYIEQQLEPLLCDFVRDRDRWRHVPELLSDVDAITSYLAGTDNTQRQVRQAARGGTAASRAVQWRYPE